MPGEYSISLRVDAVPLDDRFVLVGLWLPFSDQLVGCWVYDSWEEFENEPDS